MSETILFHEYGTQLRLGPADALILNVLCGTVGQYGVEFVLNDSERALYKQEGDAYVKLLAAKVLANPKAYIPRGQTC